MKKSPFLTILKTILIILTVIFSVLMLPLAGAGLIYNSDSYGEKIFTVGILFILSGILLTAGAILACVRKNIPSIILTITGFTLSMIMLYILVKHADSSGWSDNYTIEPASSMYMGRILPVGIPAAISVLTALIQYLSPEERILRKEKKRQKEEYENRPAPPIL